MRWSTSVKDVLTIEGSDDVSKKCDGDQTSLHYNNVHVNGRHAGVTYVFWQDTLIYSKIIVVGDEWSSEDCDSACEWSRSMLAEQ